eukprot:GHUV01054490.1.p1 GENE.GHUV01054490.1~~GHUV01054490.1.p1  ORF type:complete len:114 (-),score=28.62 GHUV01054490.1:156-497(-)
MLGHGHTAHRTQVWCISTRDSTMSLSQRTIKKMHSCTHLQISLPPRNALLLLQLQLCCQPDACRIVDLQQSPCTTEYLQQVAPTVCLLLQCTDVIAAAGAAVDPPAHLECKGH